MATPAQQQQLIALTTMMFNAPPGAKYLAELEAQLDSGQSLQQIAIGLANTPLFNSQFTGTQTDKEKIDLVLSAVGVDENSPVYEQAYSFFEGSLANGTPPGAALEEAAIFLTQTTDEAFQQAANTFRNKIEAGVKHTIELGLTSESLSELKGAVEGVTDDPDTLTQKEQQLEEQAQQEQEQPVEEEPTEEEEQGEDGTITIPKFSASVDSHTNVVSFTGNVEGDVSAKWSLDEVTFTRQGVSDSATSTTELKLTSGLLTSVDAAANATGVTLNYVTSDTVTINATGGIGNDTIRVSAVDNSYDNNSVTLVANGGDGNDYLRGGKGADELVGGNGADFLNSQIGDITAEGSVMFGGSKTEMTNGVYAESSDSDLSSASAPFVTATNTYMHNDYVAEFDHANVFEGSTANDTMVASSAKDVFLYQLGTPHGNDTIHQFNTNADEIFAVARLEDGNGGFADLVFTTKISESVTTVTANDTIAINVADGGWTYTNGQLSFDVSVLNQYLTDQTLDTDFSLDTSVQDMTIDLVGVQGTETTAGDFFGDWSSSI